jgi:DUF971 family protein
MPDAAGYTANMEAAPETVILRRDRSGLRLVWPGGDTREIEASRLRASCRCADCVRARVDATMQDTTMQDPLQETLQETLQAPFDQIAIAEIAAIGDYAINIVFTDGHARGIFPWAYLRELAFAADTQPVVPPLALHGSSA